MPEIIPPKWEFRLETNGFQHDVQYDMYTDSSVLIFKHDDGHHKQVKIPYPVLYPAYKGCEKSMEAIKQIIHTELEKD